jgi:hypothetical protein
MEPPDWLKAQLRHLLPLYYKLLVKLGLAGVCTVTATNAITGSGGGSSTTTTTTDYKVQTGGMYRSVPS